MARREDIDNAIWGDPHFEALSADAKLLYLWSFTNPLCNMAGVYKVSLSRMASETTLSPARVDKALEQLVEAAFVVYENSWLWVRSRAKHLRSKSPSMARSISRDVGSIDPAEPVRQRFLSTYESSAWLRGELAELAEESRSVEPKADTLSGGSEHPRRGLQGRALEGQRRTTATQQGQVDAPPTDLSPSLVAAVQPVKAVLDRVFSAKGGAVPPTLAAIGRALDAYPNRDHLGEAKKLEHWLVHGTGKKAPSKDVVLRYRKWLENAEAWTPPKNGSRHEAELARTRRVLEESA